MKSHALAWSTAISFFIGTLIAQADAVALVAITAGSVQDVDVPSCVTAIVEAISENKAVQLGGFTATIIAVTSLVKVLAPMIGAQLKGKYAYAATAVVTLASVVGLVVGDGVISGDEWAVLLQALAAVAAAPFGYRLLFSGTAKRSGAGVALKTMFRKDGEQ